MMKIKVMQNVLQANEEKAAEVRALLQEKGVWMANLISSPGSGKTSLLERTIPKLKEFYRIAVIEGDITTHRDAERLDRCGIPVASINTAGACHLEAVSIEKALQAFDLDQLDFIIVENVGNLVCPAEFDIGEDVKIALMSTPEGEDKPAKYPLLFREADLVVLNKIDLLPVLPFDKKGFLCELKQLKGDLTVMEVSCTKEIGFSPWLTWLEEQVRLKKKGK